MEEWTRLTKEAKEQYSVSPAPAMAVLEHPLPYDALEQATLAATLEQLARMDALEQSTRSASANAVLGHTLPHQDNVAPTGYVSGAWMALVHNSC